MRFYNELINTSGYANEFFHTGASFVLRFVSALIYFYARMNWVFVTFWNERFILIVNASSSKIVLFILIGRENYAVYKMPKICLNSKIVHF